MSSGDKSEEAIAISQDSPAIVTVTKAPGYPIPPLQCHCDLAGKLETVQLVVKEATTGYTENSQESGNFVTYVIEFGVQEQKENSDN